MRFFGGFWQLGLLPAHGASYYSLGDCNFVLFGHIENGTRTTYTALSRSADGPYWCLARLSFDSPEVDSERVVDYVLAKGLV